MASKKKLTIYISRPVPPCVRASEVRTRLAAIVAQVSKADRYVWVGASKEDAYSVFMSEAGLGRAEWLRDPLLEPRDVDINHLRRCWSFEREQVENTGQLARIIRNGEPAALLVPTQRAMNEKVQRSRDIFDHWGARQIEALVQGQRDLRLMLVDMQSRVPPDELLKRLCGVSERLLEYWQSVGSPKLDSGTLSGQSEQSVPST
jgi:hypothetical protein